MKEDIFPKREIACTYDTQLNFYEYCRTSSNETVTDYY